MRDRIQWLAQGGPLDDEQTLVQHIKHWRERVQGYDLLVPRERAAEVQLYGELLILERVTVRGAVPDNVAILLDALAELTGLLPSVTITVMTNDVVFTPTPMGFERRARTTDDLRMRPENLVSMTDVAPVVRPILTLADEARRHARPALAPEVPTGFRFEDLDRDDDATAVTRAETISIRAATSAALLFVAELRNRPRSEEQQHVFDHAMTAIGFAQMTGVAPTLVLLLEGARSQGARERDWCDLVIRAVEADDRTRDDLAAVREVLAEGSRTPVLTLSAERRAQLLAHEADDLESARHVVPAAQQWFASNRERLDELRKPST